MYQVRSVKAEDTNAILKFTRRLSQIPLSHLNTWSPLLPSTVTGLKAPLKAYPFLVCVEAEKIIGFAYAGRYQSRAAYDWDAELSIYMDPEYAGKGLGRRLYITLMALLACQNVVNVYGCLALPNTGSERLHQALGFNRLGVFRKAGYKHGMWLDIVWYEKAIAPYDIPAKPFIPFPMLEQKLIAEILEAF